MSFEKIPSGYPGLDEVLDNIRMGDNVVWQVMDLSEFRLFAQPFARRAIADGRRTLYFRFARHEPLLEPCEGLDIIALDPDEGFEPFTVAIYNAITAAGEGLVLTLCKVLPVRFGTMKVAFDNTDARHGNNEWYADCRMEEGGGSPCGRGHELVEARPLRVEGNMLIVRPLGEEDTSQHP